MDKDKELARLRALDTEQKARVLGKLESALAAADVHVFLSYEPHTETVHIKFSRYSPKRGTGNGFLAEL